MLLKQNVISTTKLSDFYKHSHSQLSVFILNEANKLLSPEIRPFPTEVSTFVQSSGLQSEANVYTSDTVRISLDFPTKTFTVSVGDESSSFKPSIPTSLSKIVQKLVEKYLLVIKGFEAAMEYEGIYNEDVE